MNRVLDTQDRRERQTVPCPASRADQALSCGWKEAGHARTPRVSVSRSIFALTDDRDRMYFGRGGKEGDQIGMLSQTERAIFGRSYADEPDKLIARLKGDEAIAEADTLLLTVPKQLGVDYNAHVIEGDLEARRARARLAVRCLRLHQPTSSSYQVP
jgi:alkanesulfonate monooxygenase SsuD/methylene tetrahydromethanopterin reductase-like flavin-dependent oxidoreductase (luciferase family)